MSDEIHGDLALPNVEFHSLLSFKISDNYLIICNSPNKAFNLGGLKSSYLITHNKMLRTKIDEQYQRASITSPNLFTIPAYLAAYNN
nr:hypothetical protein [Spiroplasma endosymbiont of Phyllotreta cruciferae]